MPVDHNHSRLGRHGTLGEPTVWDCPACGTKQEGRRPEQGCATCGAGDPNKGKAGQVESPVPITVQQRASRNPEAAPSRPRSVPAVEPVAQPLRILRLIEYLVQPGADADALLRRSLVGRIGYPWGTLTATIVDSCDDRQEDLLGLARRQPGVWLANPEAMGQPVAPQYRAVQVPMPSDESIRQTLGIIGVHDTLRQVAEQRTRQMEMPDTGPAFTPEQAALARVIYHGGADRGYGFKLCYTLALALQTIAEELAGNSEPEKFLSTQEALALANALMHEIPADWQGDVPPPAPEGEPREPV